MENKINIAELLKDCPEGMELDCALYDDVTLSEVSDNRDNKFPIKIAIGANRYRHLTKTGGYDIIPESKCVIYPKGKTTWEGFVPPCKFKDGDVISDSLGTCIFKGEGVIQGTVDYYCGVHGDYFNVKLKPTTDGHYGDIVDYRLATEEEKQKLFDAIKENGYTWNTETKTLEKIVEPKFKVGDKVRHKNNHGVVFTITSIEEDSYVCGAKAAFWFDDQDDYELVPNKFDITTLKPFDKVLVRDDNEGRWDITFYECYDNTNESYPHRTLGGYIYKYCIPYENNEHLLGKRNDCVDFYKNLE